MRQIVCDRCGKEIPGSQTTIGYVAVHRKEIKTGSFIMAANPYEKWDICDECMEKIQKFITREITSDTDTPIQKALVKSEANPIKDAEKKIKARKRAPFDVGAAQALREAGWTVLDIALELGVSEPTVLKYTHPGEPKVKKENEWAEDEPDLHPAATKTNTKIKKGGSQK